MRRPHFTRVAALVAAAVVVSTAAFGAAPAAAGEVRVARDLSFPQCIGTLPRSTSGSVGVLGTNNGIAYSTNPCLSRELEWAKRLSSAPAFYANTGNPGPAIAKHWPIGQAGPRVCSAASPNSIGCSYDYGWNAARQSFSSATDAAQRLHHIDRSDARRRVANVDWWLDVETMNTWLAVDGVPSRAAQVRDTAAIVGEMESLRYLGVSQVGIYSTSYQWNVITGGAKVTAGQFGATPQWLAGYESKAAAITGCDGAAFMVSRVHMTQYLASDGFDADIICR